MEPGRGVHMGQGSRVAERKLPGRGTPGVLTEGGRWRPSYSNTAQTWSRLSYDRFPRLGRTTRPQWL